MFGPARQLSFDLVDETVFGGPESDAYSAPLDNLASLPARRSPLRPAVAVLAIAVVASAIAITQRTPSRLAPGDSTTLRPPVVVPHHVIARRRHERHRSHRRSHRATRRPTPSPPPRVTLAP